MGGDAQLQACAPPWKMTTEHPQMVIELSKEVRDRAIASIERCSRRRKKSQTTIQSAIRIRSRVRPSKSVSCMTSTTSSSQATEPPGAPYWISSSLSIRGQSSRKPLCQRLPLPTQRQETRAVLPPM